MALATLSIDLVAKIAKFEEGLDRAGRLSEQQAARIEKAFAKVGEVIKGLGIAAVVTDQLNRVRNAVDRLDALDDLAEKFGVSASKLSAYGYASEIAGTSQEAFADGLGKLTKNLAAAAGGSAQQAAAFRAIGVETKNADGSLRSIDEVLLDVADRFAGYGNGAEKAALAQQLFGKSGADLIPVLNRGRAGINDLVGEAERLGLVMSDEAAASAAELNDNLMRLNLAGQGLYNRIASDLAPALANLAEQMTKALEQGNLLQALWDRIKGNVGGQFDQLAIDRKAAMEASFAVEAIVDKMEKLQGVIDKAKQAGQSNAALGGLQRALDAARSDYDRLAAAAAAANEKLKATASAMKPAAGDYGNEGRNYPRTLTTAPIVDSKAAEEASRRAEQIEKSYRKLIESIQQRGELARAELANNGKLNEADAFRIDALAKLSLAENGYTDAMKRSGAAAIERTVREIQALETRELLRRAADAAAAAEQQQLQALEATGLARADENRALRDYIDLLGLTEEQIEAVRIRRLEDALAVEQDLVRQAQAMELGAAEILQLQQNAQLLERQIQLRKEAAAARETRARDPLIGSADAVKDYLDQIGRAGEASRNAVSSSLSTLENDLTSSLASGKPSVSNFIDTVIAEFYRLAVVRPFLKGLFGDGGGAAGFFGNLFNPSGGGFLSAIGSLFGFPFAKGGVFGVPGITPFANGGVFDSPHLFRFANGGAMQTGVLGEAGPEAILPLRRGANGKLGVVASGAGGGGIVLAPTINNYIDSRTDQAVIQQTVDAGVKAGMAAVLERLRNEGTR